jgi:hypothetical protein
VKPPESRHCSIKKAGCGLARPSTYSDLAEVDSL